jgi:hypothetical protein
VTQPKTFSDLVVEAITNHGKASADLLRRVAKGENVDYLAEASDCLADFTRTAARFLVFWDNIATLVAVGDDESPITFSGPANCEPGETQTFELGLQSAGPPVVQSGLRRRGDGQDSIPKNSVVATTDANGQVVVTVDCSGQPRGVYEGSIQVTAATTGNASVHPYNVYINPGAQKQ